MLQNNIFDKNIQNTKRFKRNARKSIPFKFLFNIIINNTAAFLKVFLNGNKASQITREQADNDKCRRNVEHVIGERNNGEVLANHSENRAYSGLNELVNAPYNAR